MGIVDEMATESKPTIGSKAAVGVEEEEIYEQMNKWARQFPHLQKQYQLGQLFRKTRNHSQSGIDLMLQMMNSFKEVMELQLKEEQDKEKRAILQNDVKSMEHMLLLLKQANIDVEKDHILMMLRGFVS